MAATKFDAQQPQAFYLLDRRAELEALSDVSLVADGVRLPVHSQVRTMLKFLLPTGLFVSACQTLKLLCTCHARRC